MNADQDLIALNILRKAERRHQRREILTQSNHEYFMRPRCLAAIGFGLAVSGIGSFFWGAVYPWFPILATVALVYGLENRRQTERMDALIEILRERGDLDDAVKKGSFLSGNSVNYGMGKDAT